MSLPLRWVFFTFSFHHGSFCRVGLLLCLASRGCFSWVKSESQNHRCRGWGGGVYKFLASVSSQQKFETTDGPVLQPGVIASDGSVLLPCVSSSDRPVLQLRVTAQFYLERGQADPTDVKRRKSSGPILAHPFICFLSSP